MSQLLPKVKIGNIFVVSAPSGSGKSTLVNVLVSKFPERICRSISCTTRPPRDGERDGIDYYFLDEKEFETRKKSGDFLESANIYGYEYGTLKNTVSELQNCGKDVILVIDVQGAAILRKKIDAIYIFIMTPSQEELNIRIKNRGKDKLEMIEKRLRRGGEELNERFHYDYILVNDSKTVACRILESIIIAENHKNKALEKYE